MAVPIKSDRTFEAGKPEPLFAQPLPVARPTPSRDRRYDVGPDGRFLFVVPISSAAVPMTVVVNWAAGLDQKTTSH